MIAEIISIGNELLQGKIDDTNATYVSRRLAAAGIVTKNRTTVGDDREGIADALSRAAGRADIIIVTGGLGPTVDDVTVDAAADFFGTGIEIRPEIEKRVRKFYEMIGVPCTENALRQARIPAGAEVIENPVGTAPGTRFVHNGKEFMFFPGVPREMSAMIDTAVEKLVERSGRVILSRSIRVFGAGESVIESMIPTAITTAANPSFSFLPQRFQVELRLTAIGSDKEECLAFIEPVAREIYERVGDYIYGEDNDTLESVAFERLRQKGLTVAFAESCTGGLLGGRFTSVPGASEVFLGSIVSYSNEAKNRLLGVSESLLSEFGPVSEQVAKAMAAGALDRFGADVAVSVTGNAGPTSGDEKSRIGQVYIALARRKNPDAAICIARKIMRRRNDVRDIAVLAALDLIRRTMESEA